MWRNSWQKKSRREIWWQISSASTLESPPPPSTLLRRAHARKRSFLVFREGERFFFFFLNLIFHPPIPLFRLSFVFATQCEVTFHAMRGDIGREKCSVAGCGCERYFFEVYVCTYVERVHKDWRGRERVARLNSIPFVHLYIFFSRYGSFCVYRPGNDP